MSVQRFQYATLYLLNQATINRGPASINPLCYVQNHNTDDHDAGTEDTRRSNCWADGSAGEIDILEPPFWDEVAKNDSNIYDRLYATGFNSAGRCFPSQNHPTGSSGNITHHSIHNDKR